MHFHSAPVSHDDVTERRFDLDGIAGILWLPTSATADSPAPLLLLGHPGGMERMHPRLLARARQAAARGFASATIELPGRGERGASDDARRARTEMRRAVAAGILPSDAVIDEFMIPLVDQAAPEWARAIDELLPLPQIGGPVAISGGVMAVATRLAATDERIMAAGLFAGSFIPRRTIDEARTVTVPVHVLLQWDDEGNDRQRALELFDAFASPEKTLQANVGGHTGVPAFAGEDADRFFTRHLVAN